MRYARSVVNETPIDGGATMPGHRRLLLDTNVVIGALLWSGPPLRLMEQAVDAEIELFSSEKLLAELEHTLN